MRKILSQILFYLLIKVSGKRQGLTISVYLSDVMKLAQLVFEQKANKKQFTQIKIDEINASFSALRYAKDKFEKYL